MKLRRMAIITVLPLAGALWSVHWPDALAHQAPSVAENNRYLKLTPMGDRVRLAYTVYFGEIPGAEARRRIDRDGDGLIDDAEAKAHGAEVADLVAPHLTFRADGLAAPLAWAEVHVGLGLPTVDAGSYAVDLIAWICMPAADHHELVLRDEVALPRPGETEVKVEGSPGITIERSTLGDATMQLDFKLRGSGGPLADPGYQLAYRVDRSKVVQPKDGRCPADGQTATGQRGAGRARWPWIAGVGGVVVVVAGMGVLLARARRRRRAGAAQNTHG